LHYNGGLAAQSSGINGAFMKTHSERPNERRAANLWNRSCLFSTHHYCGKNLLLIFYYIRRAVNTHYQTNQLGGCYLHTVYGILRTMRPRQWTKNVLFIYPGLLFDGQFFVATSFLRVTLACILLCLVSGAVYIINDLVDVESDRQHPQKKSRPIASGQVSVQAARIAAVSIPAVTIVAAFIFSPNLAVVLSLYLLLQLGYSFYLKHIVLIDILTVTTGFMLRVVAGVVVIQVQNFSPWLYACAGLLALFLIVGKRRQDLIMLSDNAANVRATYREYNLPLLDDILRMITTSTLIAYILYTIEAPTGRIENVNLAMLTVPFVLYGLFRYLYLIHVRGEGSAPDEVLLRDRALQVTLLLWGLTFIIILYFIPKVL
jgi:4-hydroxybenzoate polyprenyltransferase